MRTRTCLIVVLVAALARAVPARAAPSLNLGGGYGSACLVNEAAAETGSAGRRCPEGPRAELSLELFGKERSKPGLTGRATRAKKRDERSGGGVGNVPFAGGAGEAAAFIVIALLAVLVAYGVFWAVTTLFAPVVTVGFYGTVDRYRGIL